MKYSVLISTALAAALGGTAFAQGGAPSSSNPDAWIRSDIGGSSTPDSSSSASGRAGAHTGLFGGDTGRLQDDMPAMDSNPSAPQPLASDPSSSATGSSGTFSRESPRNLGSDIAPWDAPTR